VPSLIKQFTFSKELNLIFLSVLLFASAMGVNLVTFPTILNQHGVDASKIGIAFTLDALGGILMSFFLSKFVGRLRMMKALGVAIFGYVAAILLIYFYKSFYLWSAIAFFMGICWFTFVITRQSWLNMLLQNNQRGVAMGIFSMLISAGIAVGPVIVKFSGANNYSSFLISASLAIFSYICLLPLKHTSQPQIESKRIPLKEFFKTNPRCFLARFFLDFQTYLLLTFTVVFGVKIGLKYEAAGLLISAYMASGFFDVFVGFLLKKISPYKMINIGFLGCMYCFLSLALYSQSYIFLLLIFFLFGIFIACIYVSVFKICNDDYANEKLVAANATFQLIGSCGSLCGSFIGGVLVDVFGTQGFPITIVLSCALYLTFLVTYEKKYS
jgi:MFS family permease